MKLCELLNRAELEIGDDDTDYAVEVLKDRLLEIRQTKRLLQKMEDRLNVLLAKSIEEIRDLGED